MKQFAFRKVPVAAILAMSLQLGCCGHGGQAKTPIDNIESEPIKLTPGEALLVAERAIKERGLPLKRELPPRVRHLNDKDVHWVSCPREMEPGVRGGSFEIRLVVDARTGEIREWRTSA